MKLWKKLDLIGRSIVLLSVAFQLILVSELQSLKQNGDVAYLMENQQWIASMIYNLSSSRSDSDMGNKASEKYSNITLYSEWQKSSLHNQVRLVNALFIAVFLVGSTLVIIGRHLEIKKQ